MLFQRTSMKRLQRHKGDWIFVHSGDLETVIERI